MSDDFLKLIRCYYWQIGCVILYLTLCFANGLVWEPTHDEGITWEQTFGPFEIPTLPADPVSVSTLYPHLNGESEHSTGDIIETLMTSGYGMHPPGYYVMIHWWTNLFGTHRVVLNLPAYLLGILALFAIRRLGNILVSDRGGGNWSMLFFALSPFFVGYLNCARPYGVALCLAILSTYSLLAIHLQSPKLRWQISFVVLSIFGLYNLYHYAFVLAWQCLLLVMLAWRGSSLELRRKEISSAIIIIVIIALGFAPWIPKLLAHIEKTGSQHWYFSDAVPLNRWPISGAETFLHLILAEVSEITVFLVITLCLMLITALLIARSLFCQPHTTVNPLVRLFWYSAPFLPAFIIAADVLQGTHAIFMAKTCFGFLPILILLIVYTCYSLSSRCLRLAGLIIWILLFAVATVGNVYSRYSSTIEYESVTNYLQSTDTNSHWVILSSNHCGYLIPLLLNLRNADVKEIRIAYSPQNELQRLIKDVSEMSKVTRVSLINMKLANDPTYDPTQIWNTKKAAFLNNLGRQVHASGWQFHLLNLDAKDPGSNIGEKTFWYTLPIRPREY